MPHEPLAQTFITGNKVRYKAEMTSIPLLLRMRAEVVSPVRGYDDIPQLIDLPTETAPRTSSSSHWTSLPGWQPWCRSRGST